MNHETIVNHLKALTINGVHQAQSGHPGGALSSFDFAYTLFSEFLRYDPRDPQWQGRDRFVLSAGHESMLIYSLLFALDWLKEEDLQNFRQLGSRTPGHPENHITPGIECTTGPLGQGAAMSVGFAIASKHLAAQIDSLFDQRTYSILGDGCLQEEIVSGAASLAGHYKLNNLIWYYDKNNQQISGPIDRTVSNDFKKMFESMGWSVTEIDGHNPEEIRTALMKANKEQHKPSLIIGNTIMAKGVATLEGSHKTHGAPLPEKERLETLKNWGIPETNKFYWPKEAKEKFQKIALSKISLADKWNKDLTTKLESNTNLRHLYQKYFNSEATTLLPELHDWSSVEKLATRNAFGEIIRNWAEHLPTLVGGSADLEPSNMTGAFANFVGDFSAKNRSGRNFAFGVREFTMSAVCNGIALHSSLIPFDATFLTFSDYSRGALRLGALQKARVIHEFTHDSFYLGEDGPTHQPIEHIMSLRMTPNLYVLRPCYARETELLMRKALELKAPSCLCLSRQSLPVLEEAKEKMMETHKGAWVLMGGEQAAEYIIFASGSEVSLAQKVAKTLEKEKNCLGRIKVVVMSCWEFFSEQDIHYKKEILETSCKKRISIEAGSTLGWQKFVGMDGLSIGIDHFGASAPAADLEKAFGFTSEAILKRINEHWL